MQEIQNDELLVKRAREGSPEAFDALVLRYQYKAVALANSILRSEELAKDASQNAFAKAYFGLKNFKEQSKFKTWLFRIIINEAKDTLRKEKSRGLYKMQHDSDRDEDAPSILELIPSSARSAKEEVEAQETKQRLEEAIRKLPEREREVFILRYLNDLSLAEVAESLGLAVGTVKAHLSHGLEKMRSMLIQNAETRTPEGFGFSKAEGR